MANNDQRRDAAHDERARELAIREERRKTEQMKADTQRKAELNEGGTTARRRKSPT